MSDAMALELGSELLFFFSSFQVHGWIMLDMNDFV